MELIGYILLAASISFLGSMQPGPVNLAVLYHATQQRFSTAFTTAVGGSIPECVFSFVALRFFLSVESYTAFFERFVWVFDSLLIVAGLVILLRKNQQEYAIKATPQQGFLSGLVLASINPQLFIFWFGIVTAFSIEGIKLMHLYQQLAFASGTMLGAFLLHVILLLAVKNNTQSRWFKWFKQYSLKVIGAVLFLIGSLHVIFILFK
jgi:threonine/homoserine/homoserine lactone efflux protein